jgi:DNA-binding transcriptional LysR family regulator
VSLNLVHLATLREFVRRGTLGAAAEALGYTPGAASQHIALLEKELGVEILVKSGRRLVLTDAGRLLAAQAGPLLDAEEQVRRSVTELDDEPSGEVLLGIWGSSAAAFLSPLLAHAATRYPQLRITSREVDVDVAARAVRLGEVDLAFGLDYPDDPLRRERDTTVSAVLRERFWVASAPGRTRRTPVSLADLADVDWILPDPATVMGRALRIAFRRAGVEPRVVHEVNDSAASLQLASQGLGLTLATDLMQRLASTPELSRRPVAEEVYRDVVIVAPEGALAGRATRAVADLAGEVVASLQKPRRSTKR